MKPKVSVLMAVYNCEAFVDAAIASIARQSFGEFEFLILDDGSTDASGEIARRWSHSDTRIDYRAQQRSGIAATRNRLLAMASADYVAWMDADDIAKENRLKRQYDFLTANPEHVACGSMVEFIDEAARLICRWKIPRSHDEIDDWHMHGKGGAIIFPASMMSRVAVETAGGFDESLTGAEDMDLFLRLAEIGKLANLESTDLQYRQHADSISHREKTTILRDKIRVMQTACERRGIGVPRAEIAEPAELSLGGLYNKWAWWAINDANIEVGRKYALKAILTRPLSLQHWKTLACAIRGH